MSTEKMTVEEVKELIQTGMDATDKIRLLISDALIVNRRGDYSSLEVAIAGFVKELRALDIKLNDYALAHPVACILSECSWIVNRETESDLDQRRARFTRARRGIDFEYLYGKIYEVRNILAELSWEDTAQPTEQGE
ncbi:hypothetical protein CENTIMANUS_00010 [Klebsiella phage vB_KpM_Centimanus]